jgi:hypothetical protein
MQTKNISSKNAADVFTLEHELINYIDAKAKCRRMKNLAVKGLCGRCLSV